MTKVLVTGGTGYIAKHVIQKLLDDSYFVRVSLRDIARADEIRAIFPDALFEFVELDLLRDEGWAEAMDGVDVLMHTASPFPAGTPKNADAVIRPAVEGTKRALQAAREAGVKRVVMTSSSAAIRNTPLRKGDTEYDESYWSSADLKQATPYEASKTLAEKWAWDFARDNQELQLTTLCPGGVFGPPLDRHYGSSIGFLKRIFDGRDPMVPDLYFPYVDVRDVANAHVWAIEKEESFGERFALNAGTESFAEMARRLDELYPDRKIPTRIAPYWLLKFMSYFDGGVKQILPNLGRKAGVSGAKAAQVFDFEYISIDTSLRDTARYFEALEAD